MNWAAFAPMSGKAFLRFAPAILVATFVAGCATQAPEPPPPAPTPPTVAIQSEAERWSARTAQLSALNSWTVRGKVAYRLPDDAGSASMLWTESPEQSRVRLSGPLGVGTTEIVSEGALLRVRRDGIDRLYPADAAPWLPSGALLPIPVTSIRHWLMGIPDPNKPVSEFALEDALAQSFVQEGWIIRVEKYDTEDGLTLPARLSLEAPQAELTLRVIPRDWSVAQP